MDYVTQGLSFDFYLVYHDVISRGVNESSGSSKDTFNSSCPLSAKDIVRPSLQFCKQSLRSEYSTVCTHALLVTFVYEENVRWSWSVHVCPR